jgi:hypothetical protein
LIGIDDRFAEVPQFGLLTGACCHPGSVQAQLMGTGARIAGFMLYLALSYGMVYFLLGTKRSLGGWNNKEQLISPAIMGAIILIIAIGTMLVGPLPALLLAVSLVAFAGYVRSSEVLTSLGVTVSDRASWARMLSRVIGAIGSLMRGPAMGLVHYGLGCARHPGIIAARRALAAGIGRLAGAESSTRRDDHDHTAQALTEQGTAQALTEQATPQALTEQGTAQALTEQGQPPPLEFAEGKPPLSSAEEHGLDAVRAALTPPKQGRPLTRDQAKRLLDCLEGR